MKTDVERKAGTGDKKPYQKPRIEDYGTIVELTGTGSGTLDDGGGGFSRSGAAG